MKGKQTLYRKVRVHNNIRRLVNTTQGATYITLRPLSELRRTWVAGFAHTDAQRDELSGAFEQRLFLSDSAHGATMMMTQPVKSSAEEQLDRQRDVDNPFRHFRSRRSAAGDKQYGAVLDPSLNTQTVDVNFTM